MRHIPTPTQSENLSSTPDDPMADFLADVRAIITRRMMCDPAGSIGFDRRLLTGKMLRARLAQRLQVATGTPGHFLRRIVAGVELFHTASLIHDDVIDGALLRRGVAADWVQRGVLSSVLLGDSLLVKSIQLVSEAGSPEIVNRFLHAVDSVCCAEIEHESLVHQGCISTEQIVDIARRKTGSLFAFVGEVCAGRDIELRAALEEAGHTIGIAYQIYDDLLDEARGSGSQNCGKTLGTDRQRGKPSFVNGGGRDRQAMEASLNRTLESITKPLDAWPHVRQALEDFRRIDLQVAGNTLGRS